jgi:outer membrane protein OmpA-like peptidoglycan-associated protein/tetratricopeptide (TPR) repeat protein
MIPHLKTTMKNLLVFLFLFLYYKSECQLITPSDEDLYDEAEEYVMAGEFRDALSIYLNLYQKGYTNANILFKIGECYVNIPGFKDLSIPFLEKALPSVSADLSGSLKLNEANAPLITYLYLGIAYRLNFQFEKARQTFNAMLAYVDTADHQTRMLIDYHTGRCNNAEALISSPAKMHQELLPESINNQYSSTHPLVLPGEKALYFMKQLKFYDAVMLAEKTTSGWEEPANLTPLIRSDGDHYLTGVSADGNTLLLTSYDPYKSGEIYCCEFINGKWTPLRKLNNHINTVFNEPHASLSPDGKTLYFASNRKGGFGGLDLYRSTLTEGDWGPAVNLGPIVNTIFDETTPFVTPDNRKLYFSSQGHYNMGGFDIFCSEWNQDDWMAPRNIGYPLNTPDDDLFYFPVDTGAVAYKSMIDKRNRQYEIYRFVHSSYPNPLRYTLNGKADLVSDVPINPGDISVIFTDRNRQDTLSVSQLSQEGKFRQQLTQGNFEISFSDSRGNLLQKNEFNIPPNFPQEQLVFNTQVFISLPDLYDTLYLEDILFSFDKSALNPQAIQFLNVLSELMHVHSQARLSITGYTDAKGSDEYNLRLSRQRASVVAEYLIGRKIDASMLMVKGLGESNPVAENSNPDGRDNPEGRKYNRRVELQIMQLPENYIILRRNTVPESFRIK